MIDIKGVNFPSDLKFFLITPFKVNRWRKAANKTGFTQILKNIRKIESGTTASDNQLLKLEKQHKITLAYLRRIKKDPNPCLITSLILYEECQKMGIKATLVIGADKKDNSIIGHSWVEVNNKAINESADQLKKYVRMTEI